MWMRIENQVGDASLYKPDRIAARKIKTDKKYSGFLPVRMAV
jgi:hypothetical protein